MPVGFVILSNKLFVGENRAQIHTEVNIFQEQSLQKELFKAEDLWLPQRGSTSHTNTFDIWKLLRMNFERSRLWKLFKYNVSRN